MEKQRDLVTERQRGRETQRDRQTNKETEILKDRKTVKYNLLRLRFVVEIIFRNQVWKVFFDDSDVAEDGDTHREDEERDGQQHGRQPVQVFFI